MGGAASIPVYSRVLLPLLLPFPDPSRETTIAQSFEHSQNPDPGGQAAKTRRPGEAAGITPC